MPKALDASDSLIVMDDPDVFDLPDASTAPPPPALPPRRRSWLGPIFFTSAGLLLSFAFGLWLDGLVRDLFSRNDWLGYAALAVASAGVLSLVAIVMRELLALRRLASVEHMRNAARAALESGDPLRARKLCSELSGFVAARPETAAGRRHLAELEGDIIDGPDLLHLAERDLLGPLDARARALVLDAAKRVSLITAVSPRAIVDIAYVIFESARLVRRIAENYGARPGAIGFIKLSRSVLAHLAVTGSIAVSDSFVQQIVGHGLAARLSAKLGEGVVNGMMTARIGLAAIDSTRPLPFVALKRPGLGDFLAALTRFARSRQEGDTNKR